MNQAVEQMRKEFGRDAVILNTKRLKQGGFFGLFGKTYFEIIGAVDSDKQEEVAPLRTVKNQKPEFNLDWSRLLYQISLAGQKQFKQYIKS